MNKYVKKKVYLNKYKPENKKPINFFTLNMAPRRLK